MIDQSEASLAEAYKRAEAGEYANAVKGLREAADRTDDPWTKAELLYHEVIFLAQMDDDDAVQARSCLTELKKAVGILVPEAVPDTSDLTAAANLAVMVRYAELKTLLAEKKQAQALKELEDLVSQYPLQLAGPASGILADIDMYHGFLLGDAGRWREARPFLEKARPPEAWKSYILYYLGQCYYEYLEYERAKPKLIEALRLGLGGHWEAGAHYVLGLVEYHLGEMKSAKEQFELSVRTADPRYPRSSRVWLWLEAVSGALGLDAEADKYHRLHMATEGNSKPN